MDDVARSRCDEIALRVDRLSFKVILSHMVLILVKLNYQASLIVSLNFSDDIDFIEISQVSGWPSVLKSNSTKLSLSSCLFFLLL